MRGRPRLVMLAEISWAILAFLLVASCARELSPPSTVGAEVSCGERVASKMMRFYAFSDSRSTSDVLVLDIKSIRQDYMAQYDAGLLRHRIFSRVLLWWPGVEARRVDGKQVLDEVVDPVLKSVYFKWLPSQNEDLLVYGRYLALKGIPQYPQADSEYRARVSEACATLEDPVPRLASLRGAVAQSLDANQTILDGVARLYPDLPRPWGVYLEYIDIPSIFD